MKSTEQDDYKRVMQEFIEGQSLILMNLMEKSNKIEDPMERELVWAKLSGMSVMYKSFCAADKYASGTDLDIVIKYLNEVASED